MANPKVEICGMIGPKLFRMHGTLVRDNTNDARAERAISKYAYTEKLKPDCRFNP